MVDCWGTIPGRQIKTRDVFKYLQWVSGGPDPPTQSVFDNQKCESTIRYLTFSTFKASPVSSVEEKSQRCSAEKCQKCCNDEESLSNGIWGWVDNEFIFISGATVTLKQHSNSHPFVSAVGQNSCITSNNDTHTGSPTDWLTDIIPTSLSSTNTLDQSYPGIRTSPGK